MNKNWYAVITADILYDKRLNSRQKVLMAVISNLSNEKGYCFASNDHFSEMLNCSISSIQRDLSVLEESKYLGRVVKLRPNGEVEIRVLTPIAPMNLPHSTDDMGGGSTGAMYNNKDINNKVNSKPPTSNLFRSSMHGGSEEGFVKAMQFYGKGKYSKYDLNYYFEQMMLWSDSKNQKRADWLATCATFIRGDIEKNKARMAPKIKPDFINIGFDGNPIIK
jgi:hypothetical protein